LSNLWIEFIAAGLIALVGLLTGAAISRIGKQTALATCLCVVILMLTLACGWLVPISMYNPAVFALVAGRIKFILLAFFVPLGLASAMPYLPYKIERRGVVVMVAVSIYVFAVFPFLGSAMAGDVMGGLPSWFDSDEVCRQSTSFTCGPAAAATALRKLGLDVSEGQIAVLSRSCPFIGTTDYNLTQALRQTVSGQSIDCAYGQWEELPELLTQQVLLVMLRGTWTNHCVAVLNTTDKAVVFADPSEGIITLSRNHFRTLWTGRGILLQGSAAK
jgi:hypothetical protein